MIIQTAILIFTAAAQSSPTLFQGFEGTTEDNWHYVITPDSLAGITSTWACEGKQALALWGTPTGNVPVFVEFAPIMLDTGLTYVLSIHYGANGPDNQEDLFLLFSLEARAKE